MTIQYTDPTLDVPPGVDFLDAEQVQKWVLECEVNKPWREPMRQRFSDLVGSLPNGARVLELGSGPGYLAETVLSGCPRLRSYTLVDFSEHMLALSRERLADIERARFVQADFKLRNWSDLMSTPYTAVIAMQAIHEIRHKRHVPGLYGQVLSLLEADGVFAVCDGIPRDASVLSQNSLYMTAQEQIDALTSAGFEDAQLELQLGPIVFVTARAPKCTG